MLVGIISDTHNNIELTVKAVEIFKDRHIDLLVHAGDLTSPRIIDYFKDFDCRFVLGNGDIDVEYLNGECTKLGFQPMDYTASFEAGGKKFMVFHGDNVPLFREAVASGKFDYIIKGHTHFFENYISNKSRIINPGALYRGEDCSIAILDTETDRVEMIRIDDGR